MGSRQEFLVLALFSSEPCNYLNPVHTRPYPELGDRRGIHRCVHLAIVVWAVTGHCWGPHTGFTHCKFRYNHLPWKSAITHPVPQLGRPENTGGGNEKRLNESQQQKSVNWGCDDHLCDSVPFVCVRYVRHFWLHNVPTFLPNSFLLAHHTLNIRWHSSCQYVTAVSMLTGDFVFCSVSRSTIRSAQPTVQVVPGAACQWTIGQKMKRSCFLVPLAYMYLALRSRNCI
jgi:hypothetical protein